MRSKKKEDRDTIYYKLNDKFTNHHIELSKHYTTNYKHYQGWIIKEYNLTVKEINKIGNNLDCFRD